MTASTKILFISADPTDAGRLRLGEEMREVREKLQLSQLRDKFKLEERHCIRPADLTQAIFDTAPDIVHFSGHGSSSGSLIFEDKSGNSFPVAPEALESVFELFSDKIVCVVLNACYSKTQAEAISKKIQYVVGMQDAIGDEAAINFSVGFYKALMNRRSIGDAFQFGLAEIQLNGLDEHTKPILLSRSAGENRLTIAEDRKVDGRTVPPSMPSRACISVKPNGGKLDSFALINPTSYSSLEELLDELFRKFLSKTLAPYTYGEQWILVEGHHSYLHEARVLAPPPWAAVDRQPTYKVAPGWYQHALADYGIRPGTEWSVCHLSDTDKFFGLVTDNPDFASFLKRHPKAAWLMRKELHILPIGEWNDTTYRYNYVFGDWLSIGPSEPGNILVDPGIDLTAYR